MSTATVKRTLLAAMADAEVFRAMFPPAAFRRWEIAGSVRRGRAEVSDVDHVVMPTFEASGLFGDADKVNLLFHRLDALVAVREIAKHVYGTNESGSPVYRWGPILRGIDFRGAKHEIWTANPDNWGVILTIRTGPAQFSERLVTQLRRNGYRNKDGHVWACAPCPACGSDRVDKACKRCDGTNLEPVERCRVPDEQTYFRLAGMKWLVPKDRR
jgi:DNA polymerase/3'-5' exonuclease PolX